MIFTSVHVKISSVHGFGVTTLNDPTTDKQYVKSVSVTDGINTHPSGSVVLPLRNPSTHQPHTDFIMPGDLVTIEFLVNSPSKKGWWLALHGPVRTISERTVMSDTGSESVCVLEVGSMMDILAADAMAIWMYFYSIEGVAPVRARLTADETNTRPWEVAYNWLTKVAFDGRTYSPAGTLGTYLHLDFGGLDANVAGDYKLTAVEGSHLSVISQFLDSPFHELYATVGTPTEFTGQLPHAATGGGVKEPGAGTILKFRAAPYPYCNVGGGANPSEWNALPLHRLTGPIAAVGERTTARSLLPERNFFIAYPGVDMFNEFYSYGLAVPVVNRDSIRCLGYRALKAETSLVRNDLTPEADLVEFHKKLSWRLAGQWNNASQWENGTISLLLSPWIKTGDRVEALSPWQSTRVYQYHVAGRQMFWDAATGGRMVLNLERGFDLAGNPDFYTKGLSEQMIDFKPVTESFRLHDKPGH